MKFLKRICSRLNRFLSPQPGKNGSSMAFVMIIGAVLVIWVLAIMPLMVAVGNNSLTLQGSYADYLQSRSAIEFCKGELEKMVESKPPYTFCVVQNADGTYTPIPKMESGSLVTAYATAVNRDPDSTGNIVDDTDTDDIPMESADGKKIVAICAVAQDTQEDNVYHITITTYNNGAKNLTYTADYTIRGSLLINPESYLKSQALPLSDFVVVDGKLSGNTLWNSTIHSLSFSTSESNNVTNLGAIQENLLPYLSGKLPGMGYADSGIFPAVFKTLVYPAGGGSNNVPEATEPTPTEPDYTDDVWSIPHPVNADTGKKGDIWFVKNNGKIKVYLRSATNGYNQTSELSSSLYKLYLNGVEYAKSASIPTTGSYRVTIDFYGSNNVLPAQGLHLGDISSAMSTSTQNEPSGITLSVNGSTVTLSGVQGAIFGYSDVTDPENIISWSNSNTIQNLNTSKTYHFFAYYPARVNDNTFYFASNVAYVGTVYSTSAVSALQNGSSYIIMSGNHAMELSGTTITDTELSGIPGLSNGSVNSTLIWTATQSNDGWQFKNSNGKYLSMPFNESNESFSLAVVDSSSKATKFSVSNTDGSISVYTTYTSGGCGGNSTAYGSLFYEGDFIAKLDKKINSNIYFVKVPSPVSAPDTDQIAVPSFPELESDSVTYGTNVVEHIRTELGISSSETFTLYANGSAQTNGNLNAGVYNIYAKIGDTYCYLEKITVTPANLTPENTLQVTCTQVSSENKIIASVSGYHTQYGGNLWIGYRTAGSTEAYKWYQAGDNHTYTFILRFGTYEFVAYETGSKNYNSLTSDPVDVTLTEPSEEAPGAGGESGSGSNDGDASMMMGSSLYFMGREGSINTEGNTIYLTTDLLVMRHDILGDGKVYVYPYSNEQNYDESPADTLFFPVNDMKNAANFEFKACTFYWIPAGTDINHATEDDLNFANRPALSLDRDADFDKLKILLRKGDYPEINMDIAYIDRENKADKVNSNGTPNNEQLAHIVSGETIGWTVDGVMVSGNDRNYGNTDNGFDSTNRQFVVCAYVSKVNDTAINRTANRIMIAAEEADASGVKSLTLGVPNSLTFTCRYFSVYASSITQTTNKGALKIVNLGKDTSFIEAIKSAIGFSKYDSRSLQIDFELFTDVFYSDGSQSLSYNRPAGIYRIEYLANSNSVNLFSEYEVKPLMVTYTNTEIKSWLNGASNDIRLVDRYMTLAAGSDPSLSLKAVGDSNLEVFSNYVFIDKNVKSYTFSTYWLAGVLGAENDFFINSQERGYKSEYLGFFTQNSAETYNGTIIYIAPDNKDKPLGVGNGGITIIQKTTSLIFGSSETKTEIPSGFYYIPACEDGTSITELALLTNDPNNAYFYGDNPNDDTDAYRINPADLPKYSIYIKSDGTLSDAYVDTGLIGNSDLGESGFSGGNVG